MKFRYIIIFLILFVIGSCRNDWDPYRFTVEEQLKFINFGKLFKEGYILVRVTRTGEFIFRHPGNESIQSREFKLLKYRDKRNGAVSYLIPTDTILKQYEGNLILFYRNLPDPEGSINIRKKKSIVVNPKKNYNWVAFNLENEITSEGILHIPLGCDSIFLWRDKFIVLEPNSPNTRIKIYDQSGNNELLDTLNGVWKGAFVMGDSLYLSMYEFYDKSSNSEEFPEGSVALYDLTEKILTPSTDNTWLINGQRVLFTPEKIRINTKTNSISGDLDPQKCFWNESSENFVIGERKTIEPGEYCFCYNKYFLISVNGIFKCSIGEMSLKEEFLGFFSTNLLLDIQNARGAFEGYETIAGKIKYGRIVPRK
ncbi:hypothetical protein KAU32_07355 [bacterium]|nr:hypothetical protein [bacterium]